MGSMGIYDSQLLFGHEQSCGILGEAIDICTYGCA